MTREERLEQEVAEKRQFLDEYAAEKRERNERLEQVAALLATPFSDEQPDVAAFGRGAWVYCKQHMRAHETGWCSVGVYDKIGLGVKTVDEALAKCREWGFPLYADRNKD